MPFGIEAFWSAGPWNPLLWGFMASSLGPTHGPGKANSPYSDSDDRGGTLYKTHRSASTVAKVADPTFKILKPNPGM